MIIIAWHAIVCSHLSGWMPLLTGTPIDHGGYHGMEQTMTEAEHSRPIPKLFSNRPSASAAEVFGPINRPLKIS